MDMEEAKRALRADLRTVLEQHASRNDVRMKNVNDAMAGYVEDMVSDFFFEIEREADDTPDTEWADMQRNRPVVL